MLNTIFIRIFAAAIYLCVADRATAQTVQEPASTNNPEYTKAYPPFRIAGNLYYVGTHDLASYLITSGKGHILINTGLASSAAQVRKNIETLGFRFSDLKILLTTQAHYDHLGAMAEIRKLTGARFWANAPDAAVLSDGGSSDYAFGNGIVIFAPVRADSLLKDGDYIRLGDIQLQLLSHPGHTKGSCSYLLKTKDDKRSYTVLIANLPTIVTERKFDQIDSYPNIAKDYASTLASMESIRFDLWVASHASQFQLHRKRKYGDGYNPAAFADKKGYDKAISELKKAYIQHTQKPEH